MPVTRVALVAGVATAIAVVAHSDAEPELAPRSCDEASVCCSRWIIDLRKPDGTTWGAIERTTLSAARDELERMRAFERRYCAFMGASYPCSDSAFTYDNPDRPRCAGTQRPASPDCAADVRGRIEPLERRVLERTRELEVSASQTDALRVRAEAVLGRAVKLPLAQTAGAAVGYNDALAKLQDLRRTLGDLCVPDTGSNEDQLWGTGFASGRVRSPARDSVNAAGQLDELERSLAPIARAPFRRVSFKTPVKVLIRGGGPAHVVLSSSVPVEDGAVIPAGDYVVASAKNDGGTGTLGDVTQSQGWERAPNATVISASSAGFQKTVVFVPLEDRDGDAVWDDRDRCPDRKGSPPDGCPRDADGDGFADDVDACPAKAGPHNGCPQVAKAPPPPGAGPVDLGDCVSYFVRYGITDWTDDTFCFATDGQRGKYVCRVFDVTNGGVGKLPKYSHASPTIPMISDLSQRPELARIAAVCFTR